MMKTLIFLNQKNQDCFGYCLSTIVTIFHDVKKVLRLILQRFFPLQMFSSIWLCNTFLDNYHQLQVLYSNNVHFHYLR